MKIYTFADKGGLFARGAIEIGGFTLSPIVLVTTATETSASITRKMLDKASWFNITTNAATDDISIPSSTMKVGEKFVVVASAGCDLTVDSGDDINGVTDGAMPLAAGARAEVLCIAPGDLLVEQITVTGTRSVPTAV